MPSSLVVERKNGIVIATISRPEKLNALNRDVFADLEALVKILEGDSQARALILTSAGDKAFCVGADLKERQGMNEKAILSRMEYVRELYLRFERLPIPLVAAMNGMALGGGMELALCCDFRILSDSALVGFPEVGLAIIPGNGGTQRLSRIIGMPRALELILSGDRITAQQALSCGMVSEVVAPGEVMPRALELCKKFLTKGPLALAQAKRAIREGFEMPLAEALKFETNCYQVTLKSKDRLEGIRAFIDKRDPQYIGN